MIYVKTCPGCRGNLAETNGLLFKYRCKSCGYGTNYNWKEVSMETEEKTERTEESTQTVTETPAETVTETTEKTQETQEEQKQD